MSTKAAVAVSQFFDAVECIGRTQGTVDTVTAQHGFIVGELAETLALALGFAPPRAEMLGLAARLHDIGKIIVPPAVVNKCGPLTAEERKLVQKHTIYGANILRIHKNPMFELAAEIALLHHELVNGKGYPFGATGSGIPTPVKIVTVCDIYEALRSPRPYKERLHHDDAIAILTGCDGRLGEDAFDREVFSCFRDNRHAVCNTYDRALNDVFSGERSLNLDF